MMVGTHIIIDPQLRELIPPLRDEERQALEENIRRDGCRDPLVVWRGHDILLDGHHRYEICQRHGIDFAVTEVELADREAAADWIDANQLGRRNLTPDQAALLRGRRYNRLKRKQGRPSKSPQNEDFKGKTAARLAREHGVSRQTIERDGQFAAAIQKTAAIQPNLERKVASGKGPTKAAVIKAAELLETHPDQARAVLEGRRTAADVVRELRREATAQRLNEVAAREAQAPEGVFDVIVIDPPWPMRKIERDCRPNQTELDYPTMTEEQLAALTIPAAEDCHVWLWTTHRFLPMALRLLDAWGLKYVCTFVWHKPGGFQPVGLPQFNCEFALYARRGTPEFLDTKAFRTCFEAPRGRHSEKPAAFYDLVRRVTAGRRLDMFNRRAIAGFVGWGKEAQ
ncbi:MAG: ParB N-terminal domain-containing protein [Phycisphaerales bacterium]|nr:ParB N-terminal domain-containing protein [Phycisphaerales bacterium]